MANDAPKYYPRSTGNDDLRIAYDKIYALQNQVEAMQSAKQNTPAPGMSVTVYFNNGFVAGSWNNNTFTAANNNNHITIYHNMTFQDGRLVGLS